MRVENVIDGYYIHEDVLINYVFSKKICACSKVFVECINCFNEFEEASSSLQLVPLAHGASPNNKKLKRA
jgi:hypothetical protein